LRRAKQKKLEAFKMWVWRRIVGVNWKDRVTSEKVLMRVEECRKLPNTIKGRKEKWIGNILCHESLMKRVIERRVEGKRPRGRRTAILDDIKEGHPYVVVKRLAQDRRAWRERYAVSWRPCYT